MTANDVAPASAIAEPMPGFGRLPPDLERDGTDPFGPATPGRPRVKRSRLKLLVLVLLAVLVLGFTSVATWYLLNRKPITSVLPVITAESLPHYEFSIYGVRKPIGVAVSSSGDRVYVWVIFTPSLILTSVTRLEPSHFVVRSVSWPRAVFSWTAWPFG